MNKKSDIKPPRPVLGRVKNNLKMGIVGFPNVGKSSTFNLLSNLDVKAENYPFCTIDPNVAKVPVPDERFTKLCEVFKPKSKVPATLSVYDIAGLVPNAHKGEGLGNAFLSHIQEVDGIFHMVRAFDSVDIVHTEGDVDPMRDVAIISNELVMKDTAAVEKKLHELKSKITRFNDDASKKERDVLEKVSALLAKGKWVKDEDWQLNEIDILNDNLFFTAKPVVYLVNISQDNYLSKKNKWLAKVKEWVDANCPGKIIPFSVEFEQKLATNESTGPTMVDKIIKTGYEVLNLNHFFTAGEDEVKCWTVIKGAKAPKAAGVIHGDFEKGFICAEVMKYPDFIELGSENAVKNAGKYKQHGREYEVEDGDIIFFKFNTPKAPAKKKV